MPVGILLLCWYATILWHCLWQVRRRPCFCNCPLHRNDIQEEKYCRESTCSFSPLVHRMHSLYHHSTHHSTHLFVQSLYWSFFTAPHRNNICSPHRTAPHRKAILFTATAPHRGVPRWPRWTPHRAHLWLALRFQFCHNLHATSPSCNVTQLSYDWYFLVFGSGFNMVLSRSLPKDLRLTFFNTKSASALLRIRTIWLGWPVWKLVLY